MQLKKGMLFHNRYELVSALGVGASAEVWMAYDTKANNLMVALKIFSQQTGIDTYGMQNFEREFTTVYNMKHSNLLPPTGYDVCDGRPYLVMQYCENGSASSMVGRADENDVINFLHDVSAGLEYLHEHNIIHQDIKPDNILLDDNCEFMVTDFGISINSKGDDSGNENVGGTRAYMGPERFRGETTAASDMWAVGATAVEMLTGTPPYGEHGGILQSSGEALPELPESLQPEVRSMIMSLLDADPAKRLTASDIRHRTELYRQTGMWKQPSRNRFWIIAGTVLACIIVCAGIFFWDYNRTKVRYYKDYTEYMGVPKGIGRVSASAQSHRAQTYRFEYRQGKLRRVALVNGAGHVIRHSSPEQLASRYSDMELSYTDGGNVDYLIVKDEQGVVRFRLDYNENMRNATFRHNDEYGTEMNLDASNNAVNNSPTQGKSRITGYLLTYDDEGRVVERHFVGLQNVPFADENNTYALKYAYDDRGRLIEVSYLAADGTLSADKNGMSTRRYEYDDEDNLIRIHYLNPEGGVAHDGNNIANVSIEYDEYGNRIAEHSLNGDNKPTIRTDVRASTVCYEYGNHGNIVATRLLGIDGQPTYSSQNYSVISDSSNADGFVVKRTFQDANGNPVMVNSDNGRYSGMLMKYVGNGLVSEVLYVDEFGQPVEAFGGVSRQAWDYDSLGRTVALRYFDGNGEPAMNEGFYHEMRVTYDQYNRPLELSYFDADGKPSTNDGFVSAYRYEYNRQGSVTRLQFIDGQGNPTTGSEGYAEIRYAFDDTGNPTEESYYDVNGRPAKDFNNVYRRVNIYDPATHMLSAYQYYDVNDEMFRSDVCKYDGRGNVIEYAMLNGLGQLMPYSVVNHLEYDANNRVVAEWATDMQGHRIIIPGTSYSRKTNVYDNNGNNVETSYWDANDKPARGELGAHRIESEYDQYNRVVRERNYDLSGTMTERRKAYDKWGNMCEVSVYDGQGNPCRLMDGCFRDEITYDQRGNVVVRAFFDVDNKPIVNTNYGFARIENVYNNHGNTTQTSYFNAEKCYLIERYSYNDRGRMIEASVFNGDNNLDDSTYGFSRITVDYDEAGVVPTTRKYYNANGQQILSQKWNAATRSWGDEDYTPAAAAAAPDAPHRDAERPTRTEPDQPASTSGWQAKVNNFKLPYKVRTDAVVERLSVSGNTVTASVKLTEYSMFEVDDDTRDMFRSAFNEIRSELRDEIGLPSSVKIRFIINDRQGRKIMDC